MPTRIVVREPDPPFSSFSSALEVSGIDDDNSVNVNDDVGRQPQGQTKSITSAGGTAAAAAAAASGGGGGGGGVDKRSEQRHEPQHRRQHPQHRLRKKKRRAFSLGHELSQMAKSDIAGSSRLVGYLSCFTSSLIVVISTFKFYQNSLIQNPDAGTPVKFTLRGNTYFRSARHSILVFKFWSAIGCGAGGVVFNLIIVAVHFDKWCLPRAWRCIFHDGSAWERNLIFFSLLFWIAGVYMCTSAYSVGVEQMNVFFSSWISLVSVGFNYDVWRESAGLTPLYDMLRSHYRKTTIHWTGASFCSVVILLSAISLRQEYKSFSHPEVRDYLGLNTITDMEWTYAFILMGVSTFICIISLILNFKFPPRPARITLAFCTIDIHWRYIEGFFLLGIIGLAAFMGFNYTSVGEVVSTPSNGYFGVWGLLFCGILAIGDWIRENKELRREIPVVIRPRISYDENSLPGEGNDAGEHHNK